MRRLGDAPPAAGHVRAARPPRRRSSPGARRSRRARVLVDQEVEQARRHVQRRDAVRGAPARRSARVPGSARPAARTSRRAAAPPNSSSANASHDTGAHCSDDLSPGRTPMNCLPEKGSDQRRGAPRPPPLGRPVDPEVYITYDHVGRRHRDTAAASPGTRAMAGSPTSSHAASDRRGPSPSAPLITGRDTGVLGQQGREPVRRELRVQRQCTPRRPSASPAPPRPGRCRGPGTRRRTVAAAARRGARRWWASRFARHPAPRT